MSNRHWGQRVTARARGARAGQGLPSELGGSGHPNLMGKDLTSVLRDGDRLARPGKVPPGGYTS